MLPLAIININGFLMSDQDTGLHGIDLVPTLDNMTSLYVEYMGSHSLKWIKDLYYSTIYIIGSSAWANIGRKFKDGLIRSCKLFSCRLIFFAYEILQIREVTICWGCTYGIKKLESLDIVIILYPPNCLQSVFLLLGKISKYPVVELSLISRSVRWQKTFLLLDSRRFVVVNKDTDIVYLPFVICIFEN